MRLTACLEGDNESRVLASVDMEEIVKITITDDIEKSNFNPQMFKSCTDTSYQCGYQQGRADKYQEITSDYMLLTEKQVEEIRADAIDEYKKKIEFEYKWLLDCKVFEPNVGIAFNTLISYAEQMKEQKNE